MEGRMRKRRVAGVAPFNPARPSAVPRPRRRRQRCLSSVLCHEGGGAYGTAVRAPVRQKSAQGSPAARPVRNAYAKRRPSRSARRPDSSRFRPTNMLASTVRKM